MLLSLLVATVTAHDVEEMVVLNTLMEMVINWEPNNAVVTESLSEENFVDQKNKLHHAKFNSRKMTFSTILTTG